MKGSMSLLLPLFFLFGTGFCLFEDQIGKWDWKFDGIGCLVDVHCSRRADGGDILVVSTVKNVIASVNLNSGGLVWRQLNEEKPQASPQIFVDGNDVVTLLNGGEYIRVFDVNTGGLKSQKRLSVSRLAVDHLAKFENAIFVLLKNELKAFEAGDSPIWSKTLDADIEWNRVFAIGKEIVVIGKQKTGKLVTKTFSVEGNQLNSDSNFDILLDGVVYSDRSLAVLNGGNLKAVFFKNGGERAGFTLKSAAGELQSLGQNFYLLKSSGGWNFVEVTENGIQEHQKTNAGDKATMTLNSAREPIFAVYYEAKKKLRILRNSETFDLDIENKDQAPVQKIALISSEDRKQYQIILIRKDCRIDFFEGRKTSRIPTLEWSRFEGLTSISSVEMVDLPLSDAQATIESEFSAVDAPLWKSFLLRIYGQSEQLRHTVLSFVHRLFTSLEAVSGGRSSVTVVLRDLFGLNLISSRTLHPGSFIGADKDKIGMERDYFNLRKVVVVSTLDGSVYGIHNDHGVILWSLYLGTQFEPLKTQLGEKKVPLFLQRSTSHYQYDAQAAVVHNLKGDKKTRVVLFDPVSGEVQNSHTFNQLRRVELSPFVNDQQLNPLLLVDVTEKIQFLPPLPSSFQSIQSLHLFNIQVDDGLLSGGRVNTTTNSFVNLWETRLNLGPDEKIKAVQGKPPNQKVHSQGKVLGDRNVLYKYSNPNLIAILTVDRAHTTLTLYLVDVVTGEIIHVAKHDRAYEPVTLLHCENWVAYTYWNEKARRTEIGVVELYEGVSAIGASDTELGLTTRSVLIAMPFGGVMEVSRRVLDARRPLEMTAELREEMVIPYIPEIPIATEDLINYNQTVLQVKGIKTSPSGLESTSLMFAYGLDLFYTRLTPSGTFDILKDDFDYILISLVMIALVVASVVCKRLSRYQTLKQSWA
ncbi:unnamed protein product [Bursaphelenchus xylophilus]|uniref:ER membrane protein complex subunit 1 n=1 Tax=Bursaphelenchus xylophilus TaxID=6326 RepID=A0A7I8WR52_BURXY|nr:unnamed protein product [Bursaphelenchus xylophilus]CAG9097633.1 unnamed protein product [Bursaphelenchus xylophilus]